MVRAAKEQPPRARIVEAAIECIQRDGIEAVTSRSIAKQAGVNLAAINYYFGGKEQVLDLALGVALDSAFSDSLVDFEKFLARHGDVREATVALLDETIEAALRFPNVGFALVHETMAQQRYDTVFVERLNTFVDALFVHLGDRLRGDTESLRRASLVQMWSTVLVSGLVPHAFDRALRVPLTDAAARIAYVRLLVDSHFAPAVKGGRRG